MISLLRLRITLLLLSGWLCFQSCARSGPELVNIFSSSREFDLHHVFAVFSFDLLGAAEILGGAIVTLGAPELQNIRIRKPTS
jgi:hypothetical protein